MRLAYLFTYFFCFFQISQIHLHIEVCSGHTYIYTKYVHSPKTMMIMSYINFYFIYKNVIKI